MEYQEIINLLENTPNQAIQQFNLERKTRLK